MTQINLSTRQKQLIDVEIRLVFAKGEAGGGGMY